MDGNRSVRDGEDNAANENTGNSAQSQADPSPQPSPQFQAPSRAQFEGPQLQADRQPALHLYPDSSSPYSEVAMYPHQNPSGSNNQSSDPVLTRLEQSHPHISQPQLSQPYSGITATGPIRTNPDDDRSEDETVARLASLSWPPRPTPRPLPPFPTGRALEPPSVAGINKPVSASSGSTISGSSGSRSGSLGVGRLDIDPVSGKPRNMRSNPNESDFEDTGTSHRPPFATQNLPPNTRLGFGALNANDAAGNDQTRTFVIYSPHADRPETPVASFAPNDSAIIQSNLGIGGCLACIHEPIQASLWMENNWNDPLLASIRNSGCGGPFAWVLSPSEPALAIFGCYNEPVVVNMAQTLAQASGFPVVIRPASDNPASTLLTQDPELRNVSDEGRRVADAMSDNEGSSEESSNGGRDRNLDDSGSIAHGLNPEERQPKRDGSHGSGGGDGDGGQPSRVDGQWDSPLHRTRVKLRLKISKAHTYAVAIGYTFKFTINGKTETPIDLDDLIHPLSRPEVIAIVDFEIETRPRETQVDRSYANIGFVAHRAESIIQRHFFHRGFDLPDKIYKRTEQRQIQRAIRATLGFSQGSPLATTAFSYNQNNDTMLCQDAALTMKPETNGTETTNHTLHITLYIKRRIRGCKLNGPTSTPYKSKLAWGSTSDQRQGSKKPLPLISFVNRNQILIWVSDPTSKARIRGIMVLMSSYLDDIKTNEELSIYEQAETQLGSGFQNPPPSIIRKDDQKPGTLSLSIAQVANPSRKKFRFVPFGTDPYPPEFMARGWDVNNNEWRSVLWPTLDKHFRAADLEGTKPVWKIQCPWKGSTTGTDVLE
ncbi:hypothetical protein MVEN_00896400 [Mycena venus]|uniref:Uncharacterized protein n=1 Tax=Mycena venus TaxID=2733690 RepID=A0A8H6YHQ2_9AGAR|nr:hypothetical protein MVEN_00896400 [Mycena venus]